MMKKVLLFVVFNAITVPCWTDPVSIGMAAFSLGKSGYKMYKKKRDAAQLDRIEKKQAKGLQDVRNTLHKAAVIKREIESISRDIRRSQEQARQFQEGLKKHGVGKMGLVFFEQQVGMPLDPGYYVPNTPLTREWKRKARIKLGGARAAWGDCPMFEWTS